MKRKLFVLIYLHFLFAISFAQNEHKCGFSLMQQQMIERNPTHGENIKAFQEALSQRSLSTFNTERISVVTIPVVVHVIHGGEAIGIGRNISDQQIQSQIDILNEDFRRKNSDTSNTPAMFRGVAADVAIEFCLATVDPSGNATSGITRHNMTISNQSAIDNTIKPATYWDSRRYLNVWSLEMPDQQILGYALLPTVTVVGTPEDGLVVDYQYFGNMGAAAGQKGRTATHEVGHYFGLSHIWANHANEGGCDNDDIIDDTPSQDQPNYFCPTHPHMSCTTEDMFMNYMDYVDDDCMNLFTQGQAQLMRAVLSGAFVSSGFASRKGLLRENATVCNLSPATCVSLDTGDTIAMSFEEDEDFVLWDIENTNMDSADFAGGDQDHTWFISADPDNDEWGPHSGDNFIVYLWNFDDATKKADDWFFTPCMYMASQRDYELRFWYAAGGDDNVPVYPEKLKVALATDQAASAVTQSIHTVDPVSNAYPNYQEAVITFKPNTSGSYSVGFHAFSDADQYALQIDDIKIKALSAASVDDGFDGTFSVYPNPTSENLYIDVAFERVQSEITIDLKDITGRKVKSLHREYVSNNKITLPINDQAEGIYFIHIKTKKGTAVQKVVIGY